MQKRAPNIVELLTLFVWFACGFVPGFYLAKSKGLFPGIFTGFIILLITMLIYGRVRSNLHKKSGKRQWGIIEAQLFTETCKQYIGRWVRFNSTPVTIGESLLVRTSAGTTVNVLNVPKGALDCVRGFCEPPRSITIEGILTEIDSDKQTITIEAYGVSPSK